MKRNLMILMALLSLSPVLRAQDVKVDGPVMERRSDRLTVGMNLDLTSLEVGSNRAVLLTPVIVKEDHVVELPSVGIYGRNRYYYYVRNGASMLTGKEERSYRASQKPTGVEIAETLAYEPWMDGAELMLRRQDYGCCGTLLDEQQMAYAQYQEPPVYRPEFVYVRPEAEKVKSRSLSGSAYIDFVVNRTDIRPDYRRNQVELGKIQATIDSVKNDADITITSVFIKGYASPEGAYAANERLAKGRTESLKAYVQNLYHFDASLMKTAFEPEDWEGLEAYVQQSSLANKDEILDIIQGDEAPDRKDQAIKRRFPADYRTLLTECYPSLRHSDYEVAYTIRTYTDVEEIKRIFRTSPQKLSLDEFYHLAEQYEPGSDAFNEVFETAVRMYPDDAQANLNAANAAMQKGDWKRAAQYLQKAGNSAEAVYARGVQAALTGNYVSALEYLKQADAQEVLEAKSAIEVIKKITNK